MKFFSFFSPSLLHSFIACSSSRQVVQKEVKEKSREIKKEASVELRHTLKLPRKALTKPLACPPSLFLFLFCRLLAANELSQVDKGWGQRKGMTPSSVPCVCPHYCAETADLAKSRFSTTPHGALLPPTSLIRSTCLLDSTLFSSIAIV